MKKHDIDEFDEFDDVEEIDPSEGHFDEVDRFAVMPKRVRGPKPPEVKVVHADESIVVVDKPAGIDCVGGTHGGETVVDEVCRLRPGLGEDVRLLCRLDRDASGVMVLARGKSAFESLKQQWRGRVRKVYWAIVRGVSEVDSGTINVPVKTIGNTKLDYRVLNQFRDYAFLEITARSGRTHEVRVQLAAIGLPVLLDSQHDKGRALFLSDFKRGYRRSRGEAQRPLIDRLALHAKRVTFVHPVTNEETIFEADLPKDMERTIKQLEKCG